MGAGASTTGLRDLIRAGIKTGSLSVKQLQAFLDKETDIKASLKGRIKGVDFDRLNMKDVDYVLDNLDDVSVRNIHARIQGKGYHTPTIMGGKKRQQSKRRRTIKGGKKSRRRI